MASFVLNTSDILAKVFEYWCLEIDSFGNVICIPNLISKSVQKLFTGKARIRIPISIIIHQRPIIICNQIRLAKVLDHVKSNENNGMFNLSSIRIIQNISHNPRKMLSEHEIRNAYAMINNAFNMEVKECVSERKMSYRKTNCCVCDAKTWWPVDPTFKCLCRKCEDIPKCPAHLKPRPYQVPLMLIFWNRYIPDRYEQAPGICCEHLSSDIFDLSFLGRTRV